MVSVLALPHIRHATLLDVLLHFQKKELSGEFFWRTKLQLLQLRACKTLDFPLLKSPSQGICTINLFQKYKNV